MRLEAFTRIFGLNRLGKQINRFRRDERGVMAIFTVYLLIGMLIITGLSIDLARHEQMRARLQDVTDRAILAGANLSGITGTETPAELEQMSKDVVIDYFKKLGMGAYIDPTKITVNAGANGSSRSVHVTTAAIVPTMFLGLAGIDQLVAPVQATATEGASDIEIILVLDVSGSMQGNKGNSSMLVRQNSGKIQQLRDAATNFVNTVLASDAAEGRVSIGIVPYSGQVRVPNALWNELTVAATPYPNAQCNTFTAAQFEEESISATTPLAGADAVRPMQAGFEIYFPYCPEAGAGQEMILPTNDRDALILAINGITDSDGNYVSGERLQAGGNTSIDYGMKWGVALLDPAMQPIFTNLTSGTTPAMPTLMNGRPYAFDNPKVQKYIVLMSDGINTSQLVLQNSFLTGPSGVFMVPGNDTFYMQGRTRGWNPRTVWWSAARIGSDDTDQWTNAEATGGLPAGAVELTYEQLWSHPDASVERLVDNLFYHIRGPRFWDIVQTTAGTGTKNTNTANICNLLKADPSDTTPHHQNLTVYTIGFDVASNTLAKDTLRGCATPVEGEGVGDPSDPNYIKPGEANFFEASTSGTELDAVFSAIARQISVLRLTQ